MKIVFMGTPDFSVNALENIVKAGHDVVGVITQPDKPKGRGGKMQYTPVKEKALELGLDVYQPQRVKETEFIEKLKEMNPDAIVVIAFGQILPKAILDMPKYGCITYMHHYFLNTEEQHLFSGQLLTAKKKQVLQQCI